jgi:hypothetical protein
LPTCSCARVVLLTFGRETVISSSPERWISGCATPIWSTRLRMMSIARFSDSVSTFDCAVGLPW